jgi:hypothetical protein
LPEAVTERLRNGPCGEVGYAAGSERHHDLDWLAGEILGQADSRQQPAGAGELQRVSSIDT